MENGLAVGFHGYLLPGHGNQLGSCHKNPPGFLTFKGQVPIGLSKGYHFRWQKITMGSMHLSEHISNTSNLVNPGRQETRTTGAHLCSQILRTAFCTLPPRSVVVLVYLFVPEVMWTSPKRYAGETTRLKLPTELPRFSIFLYLFSFLKAKQKRLQKGENMPS